MSNLLQQLLLPLLLPAILSIIFILPSLMHAKSVIEPCTSSDSCTSLLSYILPFDSKISEIAYRFQVNITDILATNSITPAIPTLGNKILRANSLVKIPISCPCVDGIRRSVSTEYIVRAADTVESIADGYGGLVSAEQIGIVNGINAKNPLLSRQSLVIPLPCTCFDNSNNGITTVYMSYVVQRGESLSNIGLEFGATVMDLEAINGLGQPVVDPGDILAVPISACSSANLNWYNESLIVPNGSYALTANNCIKCICGTDDLNAKDLVFLLGMHMFTTLFLVIVMSLPASTVAILAAKFSEVWQVLLSAQISTRPQPQQSPMSSRDPVVPFITVPSPSPSPSPAYINPSTIGTGTASGPTSYKRINSYISGDGGRLLGEAPCFNLLLPALLLHYFMW